MNVRRSVTALGERQRGVVTRAQLERIGVTAGQARSLLRSGTLVREAKGVYRCAGAPRTYEQTVALALAAAGPGSIASHRCAARLYHLGVPWFAEAEPEITVPAGVHALDARRFALVHGARHLDPVDRASTAGLPATSPLRVAVDCAGLGGDPDGYRALVDDVLFRFGTPQALRAAWTRSGHRNGVDRVEDALAPYIAGARPDSPKEMSLARVCWLGGLPLPERQVAVVDPRSGAVVARCDLAYRDARLGLEYEGRRFHAPRQRAGDVVRHEILDVLDWTILYAGKTELVPPGSGHFVAAVARHLAGRLPATHPAGRSARFVLAQLSA